MGTIRGLILAIGLFVFMTGVAMSMAAVIGKYGDGEMSMERKMVYHVSSVMLQLIGGTGIGGSMFYPSYFEMKARVKKREEDENV